MELRRYLQCAPDLGTRLPDGSGTGGTDQPTRGDFLDGMARSLRRIDCGQLRVTSALRGLFSSL